MHTFSTRQKKTFHLCTASPMRQLHIAVSAVRGLRDEKCSIDTSATMSLLAYYLWAGQAGQCHLAVSPV